MLATLGPSAASHPPRSRMPSTSLPSLTDTSSALSLSSSSLGANRSFQSQGRHKSQGDPRARLRVSPGFSVLACKMPLRTSQLVPLSGPLHSQRPSLPPGHTGTQLPGRGWDVTSPEESPLTPSPQASQAEGAPSSIWDSCCVTHTVLKQLTRASSCFGANHAECSFPASPSLCIVGALPTFQEGMDVDAVPLAWAAWGCDAGKAQARAPPASRKVTLSQVHVVERGPPNRAGIPTLRDGRKEGKTWAL